MNDACIRPSSAVAVGQRSTLHLSTGDIMFRTVLITHQDLPTASLCVPTNGKRPGRVRPILIQFLFMDAGEAD